MQIHINADIYACELTKTVAAPAFALNLDFTYQFTFTFLVQRRKSRINMQNFDSWLDFLLAGAYKYVTVW